MNKTINIISASAATLVISTTAMAAPPHAPDLTTDGNRWEITGYLDNAPGHAQAATQGLCFYDTGVSGTHQQYVWVSDTFPDWNGTAVQEGDQIFMYGEFREDVGHDSISWEIVTASKDNIGAGHWQEWLEDKRFGNTVGFANALLQRVGRCEIKDPKEAIEVYHSIDYQLDKNGEKIILPIGNVKGID